MKSLEELCRQFEIQSTAIKHSSGQPYNERKLTAITRISHGNLVVLKPITDEDVRLCNEHCRVAVFTCTVDLPFERGTHSWNKKIEEQRITFFLLGHDSRQVLNEAEVLLATTVENHTPTTIYEFYK